MKKSILFFGILLLVGMLTSCVSRLGAFTVISTKNIDWSRTSEYQRKSGKVVGEDICHIIIFIPTKLNVTIEDAVDNALEQIPGGIALVDAVLRERIFYIPYIYGQAAYIIEGSVLIDPKLAKIDDSEIKYYQGIYDKNNDCKITEISKNEYMDISYSLKETDEEADLKS